MTKEELEGFAVVCIGTDPYGGSFYRVSDENFYQTFVVDEGLIDMVPSPLGGVAYTQLKDYGKFLKKAIKALHKALPVPFEQ